MKNFTQKDKIFGPRSFGNLSTELNFYLLCPAAFLISNHYFLAIPALAKA